MTAEPSACLASLPVSMVSTRPSRSTETESYIEVLSREGPAATEGNGTMFAERGEGQVRGDASHRAARPMSPERVCRLLAEAEPIDQGAITRGVPPLQIVEEP